LRHSQTREWPDQIGGISRQNRFTRGFFADFHLSECKPHYILFRKSGGNLSNLSSTWSDEISEIENRFTIRCRISEVWKRKLKSISKFKYWWCFQGRNPDHGPGFSKTQWVWATIPISLNEHENKTRVSHEAIRNSRYTSRNL
jgi:hypothetical protein